MESWLKKHRILPAKSERSDLTSVFVKYTYCKKGKNKNKNQPTGSHGEGRAAPPRLGVDLMHVEGSWFQLST